MLSPRERKVLAYLSDRLLASGGIAPTFRETREATGLCASTLFKALKTLAARGYIRRLPRRAQATEVIANADVLRFDPVSKELVFAGVTYVRREQEEMLRDVPAMGRPAREARR